MKAEDIQGHTAQQIRDKFALPEVPKNIVNVRLEAGTKLRVGVTGEQPTWGTGGGIQFDLMKQFVGEFTNPRDL